LEVKDGSIIQRCKGQFGGGISAVEESRITLRNCTIKHCTATMGGAVYTINIAQLLMNGTLVTNNTADAGGGLAATLQSQITLVASSLTDNYAKSECFDSLQDSVPHVCACQALCSNLTCRVWSISRAGIAVMSSNPFCVLSQDFRRQLSRQQRTLGATLASPGLSKSWVAAALLGAHITARCAAVYPTDLHFVLF
jgi:hypothetical protein